MRTQEFNSKLISLLPLDEVPVHVPLRRPRPLRFERLRVGGEGKADANLTNFLSTCCALAPQLAATPWGGSPPRPLCQKICYSDCTENCPLRPWEHPGGFGIRKSASNSGHSPLRGLGGGLGDDRGTDRPMAALHFLLPTGDRRSGRRSFDSKHLPSPARRGSRSRTASPPASLCDSKGSECPCGIHTAEAASALRSRKTERAAKEKPTPISQFFLAPAAPGHPNRKPAAREDQHPAASTINRCTETIHTP